MGFIVRAVIDVSSAKQTQYLISRIRIIVYLVRVVFQEVPFLRFSYIM